MKRLRLLIATHEFSLTGAPIALLNLAGGLSSAFDVLVVSPADGPLRPHFLTRNIQAIVVPGLDVDVNMSSALLLSYDAVLANTMLSFLPIHAAHVQRKPSIWYIHEGHAANTIAKNHGPGISAAFPLASRLVVPSEFSRRFFAPARSDIQVVPYGVERRDVLQAHRSDRPLKVLQLGSIEPRKGQDVACAAIRILRNPDIQLDIVGAVLLPEYHRQLVSDCAGVAQIRFFPEVDASRTSALIGEADIVVVPSRDDVTPMVILEAMAQGKTVVASAVGGIPEMIADGQTGFLFESENAQQLSDIFARLAADRSLIHSVGTAAQAFVRTHRTLDHFRDPFVSMLQELLTPSARR